MQLRKSYGNRHKLPDPVAAVLTTDRYSKGASHCSVTELLQGPKIRILRKDGIHEDVIDRLWSSLGTAWHQYAEQALQGLPNYIVEERYYHTVLDWVVSGQVDIQSPLNDGTWCIYDWKVTTESKIERGVAAEWEEQLNCYAYLINQTTGRTISKAQVIAVIRDHKRNVFKPRQAGPVQIMDIRLWPVEQQAEYINQRVKLHQQAEEAHVFGEKLPDCTEQEQWRMPDKFAVMKEGGTRAVKVFDTQEEASDRLVQIENGWIEVRSGIARKCEGNYCGVALKCEQRAREIKEKTTRGEVTPYV